MDKKPLHPLVEAGLERKAITRWWEIEHLAEKLDVKVYFDLNGFSVCLDGVRVVNEKWTLDQAHDFLEAQLTRQRKLWNLKEPPGEELNTLLMAVEKKFPGESRFQTALRYIREAEERAKHGQEEKKDHTGTQAVGVQRS